MLHDIAWSVKFLEIWNRVPKRIWFGCYRGQTRGRLKQAAVEEAFSLSHCTKASTYVVVMKIVGTILVGHALQLKDHQCWE